MIKILYANLRRLLPNSLKKSITKSLFKTGIKPSINRTARSSFKRGIIVLSADFEMAWAFRFSKKVKDADLMGLRERGNFPELLRLFHEYEIPVTWATVGHLFLEKCISHNNSKHPEMIRPNYFENKNWKYLDGDWYDKDPCSDYIKSPAWYAPDLIDKIISSNVNHELGCHTFSHIDFSYSNCSPELAHSELEKCCRLAKQKSIKLTSMVFPGGTAGNYEILVNHGFSAYRIPMRNDIDLPYIDQFGLVAIPSSYGLDGNPTDHDIKTYLTMAKSFIDAAIDRKLVCHFWFHPSMNPWYLKNVLPKILETIYEYREQELLDVMTMRSLAKKIKNYG